MTKYYKIQYGYNQNQSVTITQEELPKAIHMFLTGKGRGLFGDTAIRGKDIIRIEPDWHKVKGWNKSWIMDEYDWEDVKPLQSAYKETYGEAKMLVQDAVKMGKENILALPFSKAKEEIRLLT